MPTAPKNDDRTQPKLERRHVHDGSSTSPGRQIVRQSWRKKISKKLVKGSCERDRVPISFRLAVTESVPLARAKRESQRIELKVFEEVSARVIDEVTCEPDTTGPA
jgi:hypothetical protein